METFGLRNQNVVQGFVSELDATKKSWVPLLNSMCFIEVKGLKISLYNGNHMLFFNISLQDNFEFTMAHETGINLWPASPSTVNAQVYSILFNDQITTNIFKQSLELLKTKAQLHYPANFFVNTNISNSHHNNGQPRPNFHMMNQFQSAPLQRNRNNAQPNNDLQQNPFRTFVPHPRRMSENIKQFKNVMPQSYLNYEETKLKERPNNNTNNNNNNNTNNKNNNDNRPIPPTPLRQNFVTDHYNSSDEKIKNIFPDNKPAPFLHKTFLELDDYYQVQEDQFYPPGPNIADHLNEGISISQTPSISEEDELCQLLTDAIAEGNAELAQEFVGKLAESMMKITFSPIPRRTDFNLFIQIVDKEDDIDGAITVTECVDPNTTTIQYLKNTMFRKHHFRVDKQIWIIGKNICHDNQTLSECGVKTTGSTVYLYMKSETLLTKETTNKNFMCDKGVETDEDITNFIRDVQQEAIQDDLANRLGFIQVEDVTRIEGDVNLMAAPPVVPEFQGWSCATCTYKNPPTFEGCKMCSAPRPGDFQVPDGYVMSQEEVERIQKGRQNEELALLVEQQRLEDEATAALLNYQRHLQAMDEKLRTNEDEFECLICFTEVEAGEGVMLRECLHSFCRECLVGTINNSEEAEVQCPFNDGFACPDIITQPEIQELLSPEDYEKYLTRCVNAAERGAADSFHCKTANCIGWCFYEDEVNEFVCPICNEFNCLTCKAIHQNQSCKEYQDDLKIRAENDDAAKKTQEMLQELITKGEAMNCPQCQIILQKKSGCDWMKCSMCRTEICWATKGPRWGPNGNGDTSGGCRCGMNGPCTPQCGNCH